jgi:hypothetical protein
LLKQKKRFTTNEKRKKNKLRLMITNLVYYHYDASKLEQAKKETRPNSQTPMLHGRPQKTKRSGNADTQVLRIPDNGGGVHKSRALHASLRPGLYRCCLHTTGFCRQFHAGAKHPAKAGCFAPVRKRAGPLPMRMRAGPLLGVCKQHRRACAPAVSRRASELNPVFDKAAWAAPRPSLRRLPKLLLGASSVVGFKKQLFHQVMARGHMLYPGFNRRKFNHSYSMVVNNHHIKLSKAFSGLSKNRLSFYIGFALKAAHQYLIVPRHKKTTRKRAMPYLVSNIESDTALLLLRCQDQYSLRTSRVSINHATWKPRAQRFVSFGDTCQKLQKYLSSHGRTKHSRWHAHGSVLRTL